MSKRLFRRPRAGSSPAPSYPTLETFDQGRREFLTRLCAGVVGAATLGGALAGCGGGRPVGEEPPEVLAGDPLPPDARLDGAASPDAGLPRSDGPPNMGGALPPDARADQQPPRPDTALAGVPRPPDARVEAPDQMAPTPGFAPPMDARVDDDGSAP